MFINSSDRNTDYINQNYRKKVTNLTVNNIELSHIVDSATRIKNELITAVDNILVYSISKLIFYISHSKYPCYKCDAQILIINIYKAINTVPRKQDPE